MTPICTCTTQNDAPAASTIALLLLLLDRFHRAATIDERSGLLMYDAWRARAEPMLTPSPYQDHHCALLIIDIDGFKAINDTYGHPAADHAIRAVADAIRKEVRTTDVLGRFGGDEFVVLLTRLLDPRTAAVIADRIRCAVARLTVSTDAPHDPRTITGLTVSVGAALYAPHTDLDLAALLWAADAALYRAKRGGKNTVRIDGHRTEAQP